MDLLIDYRPALRARTGVGEYLHGLAEALTTTAPPDERLFLFTSSWKDRPSSAALASLPGAEVIDRRVPVRGLTWAWHRLEWPPVEWLALRPFALVHSFQPLLIPARSAAQVITICDLDFLDHPGGTRGEARRDYPGLVGPHAARADGILVPSQATATEVVGRLNVPPSKVVVCPPAPPRWTVAPRLRPWSRQGPILFIGTLEPRKNPGGLLDAYERLVSSWPEAPPLVLAGAAPAGAETWLSRLDRQPLAGRARHVGYVSDSGRRQLFEEASVLVLPSWNEGFGLPVLEAMALGLPVVASNRGALPEVLGDAGLLVDPSDADRLAEALRRVLQTDGLWEQCIERGRARAARWSTSAAAATLRDLYRRSLDCHAHRHAHRD